ncbi:MAG: Copper binding protein plastocyanin/azurin family [Solirubrobacteraceae bacterium]|jgi:plastocyanin|nr:Copper binding protein plastocyanin/azurin family [Solirubrobacteraceae bacterium]
MRKLIALATVAVASAALAVPAFAATKTVKVGDNYFVKKGTKPVIKVKKGDTVIWKFSGKFAHTVTVKTGPVKFTSTAKKTGTYKETLKKAGTYKIYCKIHGAAVQSMTLKVS